MNHIKKLKSKFARVIVVFFVWTSTGLAADVLREQTIPLQKGWNAVYLEVKPLDVRPSKVFADMPVDIVARYFNRRSAAQFISNPSEQDFNQPGWGVWYAPHRPDNFLTGLHAVYGNTAYLIHATEAYQWTLNGKVEFKRLRWKADSFNLQGFSVDSDSPPTFSTFFSGSDDKIGQRVYQLIDQNWVKVTNLDSARMRSGEAYWVHCEGKTDYQGPLDLRLTGGGALSFGYGGTAQIKLGNRLDRPSIVTIEKGINGGGRLAIKQVVRELSALTTSYPPLPSTSHYALGAKDTRALELHAPRETIKGAPWTLLKISTDSGVLAWVPVTAEEKPSPTSTR